MFKIIDDKILLNFFTFLHDGQREKLLRTLVEDPRNLKRASRYAFLLKRALKQRMLYVFNTLLKKERRKGMIKETRKLVLNGENVIVDAVILERGHLQNFANSLKDIPVLFVGVRAPLKVLKERELRRPYRNNIAFLTFKPTNLHNCYDLVIDSSKVKSLDAAQIIRKKLVNFRGGVFNNNRLNQRLNEFTARFKYMLYNIRTYASMGLSLLRCKVFRCKV